MVELDENVADDGDNFGAKIHDFPFVISYSTLRIEARIIYGIEEEEETK